MYKLLVSFNKDEFKVDTWRQPLEYFLLDEKEVCKVITSLSHLNPIITLCHISVLTADDVLKDFEPKKV